MSALEKKPPCASVDMNHLELGKVESDVATPGHARKKALLRRGRHWSIGSANSGRSLVSNASVMFQRALFDLKVVDRPLYPRAGYQRYILALLGFWALMAMKALRVSMSVAVIAMKNETVEVNGTEELAFPSLQDSHTRGQVLAAFFYGYMITNIPGGLIASRHAKHTVSFGVLAGAVISLFTPVMAKHSITLLIVSRALMGAAMGGILPAIPALWSRWAPAAERTVLYTICTAGIAIGTAVSLMLSGVLASNAHWEWSFYLFGVFSIAWWFAWQYFVSDSPETHRFISQKEKEYIVCARPPIDTSSGSAFDALRYAPWRSIVRSRPFWAILVARFCHEWALYTLITGLPTFLDQTLGYDLESNGTLTAIPWLALGVSSPLAARLADYTRAHWFTTTRARKVFNTFGMFSTAIALLSASHTTNIDGALTLLTIGLALGGFAASGGYILNHLDIAPQYASVLVGITNTAATSTAFLGASVTFAIVTAKDDGHHVDELRSQWQVVFGITAALNVIGAFVFAMMANGEVQPWARFKPLTRNDMPGILYRCKNDESKPNPTKKSLVVVVEDVESAAEHAVTGQPTAHSTSL